MREDAGIARCLAPPRAFLFLLCVLVTYAMVVIPVMTYHPHWDSHGASEHHDAAATPVETTGGLGGVLESLCSSLDGCHGSMDLAVDLHWQEALSSSGLQAPDLHAFRSADFAGPFRPPTPRLSGTAGDDLSAESA